MKGARLMKKMKRWKKVLLGILAVLLILVAGAFLVVRRMFSQPSIDKALPRKMLWCKPIRDFCVAAKKMTCTNIWGFPMRKQRGALNPRRRFPRGMVSGIPHR